MYNAKEKTLTADGKEWRYITFGKGKRPLVMIQGLNTRGIKGSATPLAFMYRCFTKEYTVYLFERRSEISDGVTVRAMASDIALVMDALGIKDADILGVSQGGMIAQYLAIDRPDLVRRMVLAVTLSRNNETVRTVIERWIALTEAGDYKTLTRDMAERMYSEAYVKRYRLFMPLLTILQKPRDPERFIILARSCLTCNAYDELDKIKCPTLVLGGAKDKVVGGEGSAEIAERLGCESYIYEGLGHAAYEEAKDFNKRVLDFLAE